MEEFSFSSLAPRRGTRPMLNSWSDIGTSSMSGGAINWGNLWSGLKSFGSSFGSNIKTLGSKAWNSSAGQALREKLKDTGVQEKLIDGISSGIHGAIDLTRQELDRAIAKRMESSRNPPPGVEVEETMAPTEIRPSKRPREEEEQIVIKTNPSPQPPPYEEIFGDKKPPPFPMTRPHPSMARPVLPPTQPPITDVPTTLDLPPPPVSLSKPIGANVRPSRRTNWQGTLNRIVGLGVTSAKRRRCF